MRRSRRLTEGERWELGLFLAMLTVGCVSVAAIFHFDAVPRLFAAVFRASPQPVQTAPVTPPAASPAPVYISAPSLPSPPSQVESLVSLENLPPSLPSVGGKSKLAKKPVDDIRWYKGVEYKYVKTLKLQVTAYAPDARCCWPYDGKTTASGLSVKTNHGKLVAADTNLIPMHALVSVPGYASGAPVPVLDRGGAIKGHRLDVLLPTFDKAKDWGTQALEVRIYMPVED